MPNAVREKLNTKKKIRNNTAIIKDNSLKILTKLMTSHLRGSCSHKTAVKEHVHVSIIIINIYIFLYFNQISYNLG